MPKNTFVTGAYLAKVPHWHTDDSTWKAKFVRQMLQRNRLSPRIVGEVGCGTGEVLRQLQLHMDSQCRFVGYDIAPQAIELSRTRQNESAEVLPRRYSHGPDCTFRFVIDPGRSGAQKRWSSVLIADDCDRQGRRCIGVVAYPACDEEQICPG